MTRRQIIAAISALAFGSVLGHAQEKKSDAQLATVTLIIDGMT